MNLQKLTARELADRIEEADPPASREVYRRLNVPEPVDTDTDAQVVTLVAEVERLRRQVRSIAITRESLGRVLKGIDKTETEDPDGWWETSRGAEFGAEILRELEARMCAEGDDHADSRSGENE